MPNELFPRRRDSRSSKPSRIGKAAANRRSRGAAFERLEGRAMLAAFTFDGTPYTQNFNGLGTANSSPLGGRLDITSPTLAGWFFSETGSSANTTITAGTGSSNTGDTYNFGLAGNTDRSLGGLLSGRVAPSWGFQFTNSTGSTITTLDLAYTGKTWRIGATNRSDRIDFQYSTDATSLTTGTWIDVDGLDYANPGAATTGNGSVLHSAGISGQLAALNVAAGESLFIRWVDVNASGADDGMAIDDFSLSIPGLVVPGISASGTVPPLETIAGSASDSRSFIVAGENLTADILVTAPADFEVSTDNANFGPTATVPQTGGTASATVFVRIAATAAVGGVAGDVTLSSADATSVNVGVTGSVRPTLVALPYGPETFETTKEPWFTYSVAGGQDWAYRSSTRGVASGSNQVWEISGLDTSPGAVPADDWLMIGPFDFTSVPNPTIEFSTLNAFTNSGINVNELTLQVSTTYGGSGDPSAAWTTIPFPKPLSENTLTPSGQVPLAAVAGQAGAYVAFRYVASGTSSGQSAIWQVDNVVIFNAESLALSVPLPTAIDEGATGGTGVVRIPAAVSENLVVTLTSGAADRLLLHGGDFNPAGSTEVTILAGQTEATFFIDAIRDFVADPDAVVTVTAAAAGYDSATGSVTVRNIDLPAASLTADGYTENFAGFAAATPDLPQGWSATGLVTSFSASTAEGDQVSWGSGFRSGYRGGESVFGYQHTSSSTETFEQVLTLRNDAGQEITELSISYLGRVARAGETRTPSYTVTVNGVVQTALGYSTLDGDNVARVATVSGISIPVGQTVEIVWSSDGGPESSGSSKQIGISQVSVAVGAVVAPPAVSSLSVPPATIGRTTAEVSANVTSDGGAEIEEGGRGFVLLATADLAGGELTLDTADRIVVLDAFAGTGPMTGTFTGLGAGTSYTLRAFATNSEGTAYTAPQTFLTETPPVSLADGYSQTFADYTGTLPVGWKVASSQNAVAYAGLWGTGTGAGFRGVGTDTSGVLGYQHTGGTGTLTVSLVMVNDTGSTIDTLNVSYLGRVARTAETRFPAWTVAVNGVVVPELAYSTDNTAGEAGAAGDELVSAAISGLSLAPGAEVTITWVSERDSGQSGGSSRQIGIGDVQITAEAAGLPVISEWNFDAAFDANLGPIAATTGSGSARLIGGTTHVTTELNVWRVTTFPGQSLASGTAGVEFLSSTVGRQDIVFSFEQYGSGTASRWAQVDYTLDGGATWVTGFWNNQGFLPDGPYTPYSVDFSSVAAANDNPDFGVRVVSIYSPQDFNENSVTSHLGNTAYMRINAEATYPPAPGVGAITRVYAGSGNWRFENVTVSGESLPATNPTVSTPTSAAISTQTARLGGTVVADGFATLTARGVIIAPASFVGDLLLGAQGVTAVPAATAELGAFTVNASGLTLSTNYRFRAYATNAGGFTAYSTEGAFQTLATVTPPVVSAATATAVTGITAMLGGTVDGDGGSELTAMGVVFSSTLTGDALVVGAVGATVLPAAALETSTFTVAATGLSELTAYTYRVFATNAEGTSYTAGQTFTTAGTATVATTPAVSGITSFTATLAGTATAGSDILERGFVLAPTAVNAAPTLGGTGVTQVIAAAVSGEDTPVSGDYTAVATRLSSLAGYSFRAYATTGAGTTYGDVATFATAEGAIAFWDFAGDTTLTAGGVGTAGHVNTTEAAEADAWRVTTFPAQSVGSGTAGVQFLVPTVGYSDIELSFRHYASNTGSRWAQLDYTLDGGQNWTNGFWDNEGVVAGEAYYPFTVDFSAVAGAANNPDFGVRIVSIFSPVEFNPEVPNETYAPDTAYHRGRLSGGKNGYAGTGNWRFQNVTFAGTVITAQSPLVDAAALSVVKGSSATLGGAVVSGGGRDVTTRGVLVAPATFSGTLELGAPGVVRFDAAAGGLGSFTADATGLDLSTAYVYRTFATNADGLTGYSATSQFTTLAVDLISTTTTLDAFSAQATFGTPVTFIGTVSAVGSAQIPVGTVQIRSGGPSGTLLASTTVAGDGTYSAASSSIAIGTYSGIAAYFLVGGTFDSSNSSPAGSLTIDPRAFTPGNLLVLRVGDGTSTLGVTADAVTLVEFTPDGTLVQEIPVAAAGSSALTLGTNPNNGILSLAADRQSVTFGGYRAAAGSSDPGPANVPRVIGSVGVDGVIDTSRGFAGVFTREDFRSVATDDGSNFWLSGAGLENSGGIRHVTADGTSLTGLLAPPPANPNMRQVIVLDGNLFTASGSNPTGRSIYQVGTGLPTTAGQPLVNVLPIGGSSQWQSFFFADLDPAVSWGNTGFDTIYATDFTAITKLSYVVGDAGLSWVDSGSVALAGASGITGFTGSDGTVTLYVSSTTLSAGGISTIVDSSGAGGALSATAANINTATPVAAGTNYAFRGLAFVPRAGIDTTAAVSAINSTVTQNFLQEVTFTATITAATGSASPTGVVQFRSGGVLLATATLTGSSATATATVATTAIPFGTYTGITARYIPDGNASANLFNPSVSAAFGTDLVVEPQGEVTTTTITSITPLTAAYGDTVTFSGTVTGDGGGSSSGTVEIRAGGASGPVIASGSVTGGTFSVSSTTIPGGSYSGIVAVFSGVAGFQNSVSAAFQGTLEVSFTTLTAGDIGFTGFQPAAPESLSFVLLRDVIAGTTVTFTDNAWDGSALGTGEGTSTITFTQAFAAGTVFKYLEYDLLPGDINGERWAEVVGSSFSTAGLFDVTSSNFGLSTSGDNLFAYQGAAPTSGSASNWIAGFSTRPFLTEGSTSAQTSYLPAALATGNAAFSLGLAEGVAQGRRLADLGSVSGTPAQIRATIADPSKWVVTTAASDFTSTTTFVVDTTAQPATAPKVTGLFVRGSTWENAYLDLDVFTTVDGNRLGWQLPDGSAQLANGSAVSWVSADTISVRFSEPVQLPAVDAMQIVRGNPSGNATTTPVSRQLLAGGTVVQWTFAESLANGRYFVSIPSAGVTNAGGTAVLDGEWVTSQSTFATGSGDGTAGGIFNFGFMVLRGGVSGQGSVQVSDVLLTRTRIGSPVAADNFRFGVFGLASVTVSNFLSVRSQVGASVNGFTDPTPPAEAGNVLSMTGFSIMPTGFAGDTEAAVVKTPSVKLMADSAERFADTPVQDPTLEPVTSPVVFKLISRIPTAIADSPATPDTASVAPAAWAWFAIESEQQAKKK